MKSPSTTTRHRLDFTRCGNRIAHLCSLHWHYESMHDGKRYTYTFCRRHFKYKSSMRSHIENKHWGIRPETGQPNSAEGSQSTLSYYLSLPLPVSDESTSIDSTAHNDTPNQNTSGSKEASACELLVDPYVTEILSHKTLFNVRLLCVILPYWSHIKSWKTPFFRIQDRIRVHDLCKGT